MYLSEKELPLGWALTTLGSIATPSSDKIEPSDYQGDHYLSLKHIQAHTGRILGWGDPQTVKSTISVFHQGDVLYGRLRPYLNKVVIPPFEGICSTDILVFPIMAAIKRAFLARFLSHPKVVEFAVQNSKGINLPRISFRTLAEHPFALPPLNEQRRIVAKIEALQARSKKAREALEAIPPLLDKFRQSVLASAFRGDLTAHWRAKNPDVEPATKLLERIRIERRRRWEESELAKMKAKGKTPKNDKWKDKYKEPTPVDTTDLPELPEGWCRLTLGAIARVEGGYAFKSGDFSSDGVPLIRIGDLRDGKVVISEKTVRLPDSFLSKHIRFMLNGGDLLMGLSGATTGKLGYYEGDEPSLLNQRVGRFLPRCDSVVDDVFLGLAVEGISHKVLNQAWGGAQPNISPSALEENTIAVPTLEEQKAIVQMVRVCWSVRDSVTKSVKEIQAKLGDLDESILAKAFRGELVPQDPNDEPASVLLERIKAEQAKTEKPKRKTRKKKGTAS